MNDKQYEEYKALKQETDELKNFIHWCGERKYMAKVISRKYRISIGRAACGFLGSTEIILSEGLQTEIIEVIKRYVEQNERKMEQL